MNQWIKTSAALCMVGFSMAAMAQTVEVSNAWARATVQGQKATGAYMTLKSKDGTRLVSVTSPAAGMTEVHEMKLNNNVMVMRAVEGGLELPAGKAVELKPGSYHLMLMDLKVTLPKDTTVPITLLFKDANGKESKTELKVPVSQTPPPGAITAIGQHGSHSVKGMHHGN